jgi:hypothetical protein
MQRAKENKVKKMERSARPSTLLPKDSFGLFFTRLEFNKNLPKK